MRGSISAEQLNAMRVAGGSSPQMGHDVPLASSRGKLSAEELKALREAPAVQEPSLWESLGRGAVQGVTFNFGDEISGAANAAIDSVLPESMRLSQKENFSDRYADIRDRERGANKDAQEANPKTYFAGELAGGISAPLGVGKAGAAALDAGKLAGLGIKEGIKQGAKAGAAQGALAGFGGGEGAAGSAVNAAQGAALGAGIGGAAGAVPGVIRGGKQLFNKAKEEGADLLNTFSGGFQEGAEASAQAPLNVPVVDSLRNTKEGIKGGVQALAKRGELADDLTKLNPDGDGLIGSDLFLPGASPTKVWVANKAATYAPGNVSQDTANQVLQMGTSRRNAAMDFDNKLAAKELAPDVNELSQIFKKGKGSAYENLQNQAREGFQHEMAADVIPKLQSLSEDASQIPGVSGSAANVLKQVDAIVNQGLGPKDWGLTQGKVFAETVPSEAFDRLQKARQLLFSQAKTTRKAGLDVESDILTSAYKSIDDALKQAPGKELADKIYRQGTNLRDEFFGTTEFKNPATKRPEVDEFKIAKLFGNNDTAGRFKNNLEKMRSFLAEHGDSLGQDTKARMSALLDRFDALQQKATDKRTLEALRNNPSKTSASIERANALLNKQGLSSEALRSPASFLNAGDQFMKEFSQSLYNKPYEQLSKSEQNKLVKMYLWRNNNRNATREQEGAAFKKIFEGA